MRQLFFLFLISLIVGCDSTDPRLSEVVDYQKRLYTLLDVDTNPLESETLPYPEKRQLKRPVKPVPINWSDFFSTIHCGRLQSIIAEKNSQLGRVMEPATDLFYEVSVSVEIRKCAEQLSDQSDEWQRAIVLKREQFTSKAWNNTWGSDYWQRLMSTSSLQTEVSKSSVSELVSALSQLRNALVNKESAKDNWYRPFSAIEAKQGVVGSLVFEAQGHWAAMQAINRVMSERIDSVCPQSVKTQTSDYLYNVLTRFYTAKVQRRQAELLEALIMLENEFEQWTSFFPDNNARFDSWMNNTLKRDSSNRLSLRLTESIRQHIEHWKTLGKFCNQSIGNRR